jgi:hypothetical protein
MFGLLKNIITLLLFVSKDPLNLLVAPLIDRKNKTFSYKQLSQSGGAVKLSGSSPNLGGIAPIL